MICDILRYLLDLEFIHPWPDSVELQLFPQNRCPEQEVLHLCSHSISLVMLFVPNLMCPCDLCATCWALVQLDSALSAGDQVPTRNVYYLDQVVLANDALLDPLYLRLVFGLAEAVLFLWPPRVDKATHGFG